MFSKRAFTLMMVLAVSSVHAEDETTEDATYATDDEIAAQAEEQFAAIDGDGDGSVTWTEWEENINNILDSEDALSLDETHEYFWAIDGNEDGNLDVDEVTVWQTINFGEPEDEENEDEFDAWFEWTDHDADGCVTWGEFKASMFRLNFLGRSDEFIWSWYQFSDAFDDDEYHETNGCATYDSLSDEYWANREFESDWNIMDRIDSTTGERQGWVDLDTWKAIPVFVHNDASADALTQTFTEYDTNADGQLTYEELFIELRTNQHRWEDFNEVWALIDVDNDGYTTPEEAQPGFEAATGEDVTLDAAEALLEGFDTNGDGEIAKTEMWIVETQEYQVEKQEAQEEAAENAAYEAREYDWHVYDRNYDYTISWDELTWIRDILGEDDDTLSDIMSWWGGSTSSGLSWDSWNEKMDTIEEEMPLLHAFWPASDTSGDGCIDYEEFAFAIPNFTSEDVDTLWGEVNPDNAETVCGWDDICSAWFGSSSPCEDTIESLREYGDWKMGQEDGFNEVNTSGSGCVTYDELAASEELGEDADDLWDITTGGDSSVSCVSMSDYATTWYQIEQHRTQSLTFWSETLDAWGLGYVDVNVLEMQYYENVYDNEDLNWVPTNFMETVREFGEDRVTLYMYCMGLAQHEYICNDYNSTEDNEDEEDQEDWEEDEDNYDYEDEDELEQQFKTGWYSIDADRDENVTEAELYAAYQDVMTGEEITLMLTTLGENYNIAYDSAWDFYRSFDNTNNEALSELASWSGAYESCYDDDGNWTDGCDPTLTWDGVTSVWSSSLDIARMGWGVDEFWIAATGDDTFETTEVSKSDACKNAMYPEMPWVCVDPVSTSTTDYDEDFVNGWYGMDTDSDESITCDEFLGGLQQLMVVAESQVTEWCNTYGDASVATISMDQAWTWYQVVILEEHESLRSGFDDVWYAAMTDVEFEDWDNWKWEDTYLDTWESDSNFETTFADAGLVPDQFETIEALFTYMDLDGNGGVNYYEGCVAVNQRHDVCLDYNDLPSWADRPFWTQDVDSDGFVTYTEFKWGSEEGEAWLEAVWTYCNTDTSDDLTQDEVTTCKEAIQYAEQIWSEGLCMESRDDVTRDEAYACSEGVDSPIIDVDTIFEYDTDGDDVLSWSDVCSVYLPNFDYYCGGDGDKAVADIDTDGSGDISEDEFNAYLEEEGAIDSDGNVEGLGVPADLVFALYDYDNDQVISAEEIDEIDDHVGELFDGEASSILNTMWYAADEDESDYIDYEEFGNFLSNSAWLADVDIPDDDSMTTIWTNLSAGEEGISYINALRAMKVVMNAGLTQLISENA